MFLAKDFQCSDSSSWALVFFLSFIFQPFPLFHPFCTSKYPSTFNLVSSISSSLLVLLETIISSSFVSLLFPAFPNLEFLLFIKSVLIFFPSLSIFLVVFPSKSFQPSCSSLRYSLLLLSSCQFSFKVDFSFPSKSCNSSCDWFQPPGIFSSLL